MNYKKYFLLVLIIQVLPLTAKMSTKEKIMVGAGAAGLAIGACYLADTLDEISSTDYRPPKPNRKIDQLLDDSAYQIKKCVNTFSYELDLVEDYQGTGSGHIKDTLENRLINHIQRSGRVSDYKDHLLYTVIAELLETQRLLKGCTRNAWPLATSYQQDQINNYLDKINLLINQLDAILNIIDNYRYRSLKCSCCLK